MASGHGWVWGRLGKGAVSKDRHAAMGQNMLYRSLCIQFCTGCRYLPLPACAVIQPRAVKCSCLLPCRKLVLLSFLLRRQLGGGAARRCACSGSGTCGGAGGGGGGGRRRTADGVRAAATRGQAQRCQLQHPQGDLSTRHACARVVLPACAYVYMHRSIPVRTDTACANTVKCVCL